MVKNVSVRLIIFITIILFFSINANAIWTEKNSIVLGKWGNGEDEFGFEPGDIIDKFPKSFFVLSDGKIIIKDQVNNRSKIYNNHGVLLVNTNKIGLNISEINSNTILFFKWDRKLKKQVLALYSILKNELTIINKDLQFDYHINSDLSYLHDQIYYWDGKKHGYQISINGNIIKKYKTRPLILGNQKLERKDENFKLLATFPGKEYSVIIPKQRPDKIIRDSLNNLFVIQRIVEVLKSETNEEEFKQHYRIIRFDNCNEKEEINLPHNEFEIIHITNKPHPIGYERNIIVEYGEPVISPIGDLYCWARTKTHYKILKWTWQGESSAPQSLKATLTDNKMHLIWDTPTEDQKTVTSYEINRSTDVCGPYNQIKEVDKNTLTFTDKDVQVGDTYYYQIRAIRDGQYSGYSNKAIGIVE